MADLNSMLSNNILARALLEHAGRDVVLALADLHNGIAWNMGARGAGAANRAVADALYEVASEHAAEMVARGEIVQVEVHPVIALEPAA